MAKSFLECAVIDRTGCVCVSALDQEEVLKQSSSAYIHTHIVVCDYLVIDVVLLIRDAPHECLCVHVPCQLG